MADDIFDKVTGKTIETEDSGDNPYAEIVTEGRQGQKQDLRLSMFKAANVNPDQYSAERDLSKDTGVPIDIVQRNFEKVQTKSKFKPNQYDELLNSSPKLANWLINPENSSLAQDDIGNLSFFERLKFSVIRTQNKLRAAQFSTELSMLAGKDLLSSVGLGEELSDLDINRMGFAQGMTRSYNEKRVSGEDTGFIEGIPGAVLEQIPVLSEIGAGAVKGFAVGALPGAVTGFFTGGPAGAFAAGTTTGTIGAKLGVGFTAFKLEGGSALLEFRDFRDEEGRPLDPNVATGGALMVGLVNASLESLSLGLVAKTFHGAKGLIRSRIKDIIRTESGRQAMVNIAKRYAQSVAGEGVTEFLQEAMTIMGGEFSKVASDGSFDEATLSSAIDNILSEESFERAGSAGRTGLQVGIALGAPGTALSASVEIGREKSVKSNQEVIDDMAVTVKESKLLGRAPDKFQEYVGDALENTSKEKMRVSGEKLIELFQSIDEGSKQDAVARFNLAVSDFDAQLAEAVALGGDVIFPTEGYATHIMPSDFHEPLRENLSFGVDGISTNELKELASQAPEIEAQEAEAITAELEREAPERDTSRDIVNNVQTQLVEAGQPLEVAEQYAELYGAFFKTTGERAGVDPLELFERRGFKVEGETSKPLQGKDITEFDLLIDRLRAERFPVQRDITGETLVPFLKKRGGVTGGEFASIGAGEVFGLLSEKGLTPDQAAELAFESGFIKDRDITQLFDALDNELRGKPAVSPQVGINERELAAQIELETLNEDLVLAGIDIQTATNEDVKVALGVEDVKKDPGIAGKVTELFQKISGKKPDKKIKLQDVSKKRGSFVFNEERTISIVNLFKDANLSTFLHESGHFFLENLRDIAGNEEVSEQIKDDWNIILEHLGVSESGEITTEHHEKFARSFEAFLFEGKSPSIELESAFHRFRSWLVSIYKSIKALNVDVNDEVRGVFDRMLATDIEIEATRKRFNRDDLFTKIGFSGMTKVEFGEYIELSRKANQEAKDQLTSKALEEITRERKSWWKEERAKVHVVVTESVNSRPVYQATNYLHTGEFLVGDVPAGVKPMKLSRTALVGQYGKELLKRLPIGAGNSRVYADGDKATHPDTVAAFFGLSSGDQLVKEMLNAPKRQDVIENETDIAMKKKHGDMINDGTMIEEAVRAVHNDTSGKLLATEIRQLERLEGLRPVERGAVRAVGVTGGKSVSFWENALEKAQAELVVAEKKGDAIATEQAKLKVISLQEQTKLAVGARAADRIATERTKIAVKIDTKVTRKVAQGLLLSKKIKDITLGRYAQSSIKASREAAIAVAKKDYTAAREAKHRQLMNHYLYQEGLKIKTQIDKSINNFSKHVQGKKKLPPEYADQVSALLEQYQFKKSVSLKTAQKRKSLSEWISDQEAMGNQVDIDDSVRREVDKVHYKELTVREFLNLKDAVKVIEHIGGLKNKLIASKEKRDLQEVADGITESAYANNKVLKKNQDFSPRVKDKVFNRVGKIHAEHTKMEFLFEYLDGDQILGPAWTALFKPIADAETSEQAMTEKISVELEKAFNKFTRLDRARWKLDKTYFEAVDLNLTKEEVLSVALNWGNAGNREALARGYGWSEDQVKSILDSMTKKDWDLTQELWDIVDSLWPEIAQLQKDLTGLTPKKVEATPVSTLHGDYKGGYYPLKYDLSKSEVTPDTDQKSRDTNLFENNWLNPMTKRGHVKERVGSGGQAVKLSLSVLTGHIFNVVHDLTHRKAIMDVDKLSRKDDVRKAIVDTQGFEMYNQVGPWLKDIANEKNVPDQTWEQLMRRLRIGATTVNMGWKISTAIVQPLGYSQTIAKLGVKYSMIGLNKFYGTPGEIGKKTDFVFERSTMMRNRNKTFDRDVRDSLRKIDVKGPFYEIQQSFFALTGMTDMGVALPSWLGAYEKGMAEFNGDEIKAIDFADNIVRTTQSAGGLKDLARIQRGSETHKIFTMFYSYFSVFYNLLSRSAKKTQSVKDMPRFVADMFFIWFIPSVLSEVVAGRGPDDDEDKAEWYAKTIGSYPAMGVIGLRDVVSAMTTDYGYGMTPVADAFETSIRLAGKIGKKEFDEDAAKAALNTAGYFFRLPTKQLWITGSYLDDLSEGDIDFSLRDMFLHRSN